MIEDSGHLEQAPFMRRAIELSRLSIADGGGPFGAVVVSNGAIVGEGWNRVTGSNDPTAHAEIVAIRDACSHLGTFALEGAVLYASCEPCPMCLAAIYWARIERVVYSNTTADAAAIGFDDAFLYEQMAIPAAARGLTLERLPSQEARAVLAEWQALEGRTPY